MSMPGGVTQSAKKARSFSLFTNPSMDMLKLKYDAVLSLVSAHTRCFSRPMFPVAYAAPTIEPMDVPHTISGWMSSSASASMMPICDQPRAEPLPSANPIFMADRLIAYSILPGGGQGGCAFFEVFFDRVPDFLYGVPPFLSIALQIVS